MAASASNVKESPKSVQYVANEFEFISPKSDTGNESSSYPACVEKTGAKRKREKKTVPASNLTGEDVNGYFGDVLYVNCPKCSKGPEIEGTNGDEILNSIIESLKLANISVSDVSNFHKCLKNCVPKQLRDQVDSFITQWRYILDGFTFNNSSPEATQQSYGQLERIIDKKIPMGSHRAFYCFSDFCGSVRMLRKQDEKANLLHTNLKTFWGHMFQLALGEKFWHGVAVNGSVTEQVEVVQTSVQGAQAADGRDIKPGSLILNPEIKVNGQATYIFNVKQRSKSEVEIVSMPDLSLNMTHFQQVQSEHESQVKVRCRVVAVEIKTTCCGGAKTMNMLKDHVTPTESEGASSKTESDQDTSPAPKKKFPVPVDIVKQKGATTSSNRSRMEGLRKQHFAELLGSIKDMRPEKEYQKLTDNLKMFGLYIVMERVYITCLNVQPAESPPAQGNVGHFQLNLDKYNFLHQKTYECGPQKSKLRMISTKYLNILNPLHMEVLLNFVQFLVWQEYNNMAEEKIAV